jgi:hypothetical protein
MHLAHLSNGGTYTYQFGMHWGFQAHKNTGGVLTFDAGSSPSVGDGDHLSLSLSLSLQKRTQNEKCNQDQGIFEFCHLRPVQMSGEK